MNSARRLGVRVAVASNSPREWVEARLTQVGLRDLVEVLSDHPLRTRRYYRQLEY